MIVYAIEFLLFMFLILGAGGLYLLLINSKSFARTVKRIFDVEEDVEVDLDEARAKAKKYVEENLEEAKRAVSAARTVRKRLKKEKE